MVAHLVWDQGAAGSNPVASTTSKQSSLCFDFFMQKNRPPATLLLRFRKMSRSSRLFTCKRAHNAFVLLATFCECPSAGEKRFFRFSLSTFIKAIEEQLEKTESTKGMNLLDYVSALLSAAALIPGIDTFVDLISIPVDLFRGDLISAVFDVAGIIPIIGEVGDTNKALRIADKAIDGAKVADGVNDAITLSTRSKLLNKAQNPKLRNAINEIYRDGATIGNGGLADAIRHELKTGELVGGKSHIQKGKERIKNLENILHKQELSNSDREIAEELIQDIGLALRGE